MTKRNVQLLFLLVVGVLACKPRTPGNSSAVKEIRSDDKPGGAFDPDRANPAHVMNLPFTLAGYTTDAPNLWDLQPDVVANYYPKLPRNVNEAVDAELSALHTALHYGKVPPHRFGTFEIVLPDGESRFVRDQHYLLNEGAEGQQVGIRIVPVTDERNPVKVDVVDVNGNSLGKTVNVNASDEMDKFLRTYENLSPGDYIFNPLVYFHPEGWKGNLQELGDSHVSNMLRSENGQTHMGAYIGRGRTRNSPYDYHGRVWYNRGYPVIVSQVQLEGVNQAALNHNLYVTERLLNEGNDRVIFPNDYKQDWYRTHTLKSTLDFYRGWIDRTWKRPEDIALAGSAEKAKPFYETLRDDPTYWTYCAEHITLVINVGLNVPQNEKSYVEIWGEVDGKKLFASAQKLWTTMDKVDDEPAREKNFPNISYDRFGSDKAKPLWKLEGIPKEEVTQVSEVGRGLAWTPETTADITKAYFAQYASWVDVGSGVMVGSMFGFSQIVIGRMQIHAYEYVKRLEPFFLKIVKSESKTIFHPNSKLKIPVPQAGGKVMSFLEIKEAMGPEIAAQAYVAYLQAALKAVADNIAGLQEVLNQENAMLKQRYPADKAKYEANLVKYNAAKAKFEEAVSKGELAAMPAKPVEPEAPPAKAINIKAEMLDPMIAWAAQNVQQIASQTPVDPNESWNEFTKDTKSDVADAQGQKILTALPGSEADLVGYDDNGEPIPAPKFYSSPPVIHRIASNIHPANRFVKIREIATAMDAHEVRKVEGATQKEYDFKAPADVKPVTVCAGTAKETPPCMAQDVKRFYDEEMAK